MADREFPIVVKLGGRERVRAKLVDIGWRGTYDTIRMWTSRGRIPGDAQLLLMGIAEAEGVDYAASDFSPANVQPQAA